MRISSKNANSNGIRAINDYYFLGYTIYYWRTRSQLEVDFILYGEKGLFAFEIKSTSRLTDKDFKGLKAFQSDYNMAHCFMVYLGDRDYIEQDIHVIPMTKLLFMLREILIN